MFLPKLNIKTGKRAIIFFTLPEWNFAKNYLKLQNSSSFLNINLKYDERGIIAGPLIGAPVLSFLLELLKTLGIEEIIGVGWAGKFKEASLDLGDIFLPVKAYSLEGVSRFYYPTKSVFSPDKGFLKKLEEELKKEHLFYRKGNIVSVDAPMRFEKDKNLIKKFNQKVFAMDMETSAFFSVSSSLQIKGVVLHFIIDEIGETIVKRPEKIIREKRKKLIKIIERFLNYEF